MRSAPLSSSSWWRWWHLSPFMCPPRAFWQPCLRVTWFVIALAFAVTNMVAEIKLAIAMDGRERKVSQLLGEVETAVSWFPLDLRLRSYQRWVRAEVARKVHADANGVEEAGPVHAGGGAQPGIR